VTETNNSSTQFYPKEQLYNCRCSQSLENFQDKATLGKPRSKDKFQKRYDQALSPSHLLANIIHPKYRGIMLLMMSMELEWIWLQNNMPQ